MHEDLVTLQESSSLPIPPQPPRPLLGSNIAGFSVSNFPMMPAPMAQPLAAYNSLEGGLGPIGGNQGEMLTKPIRPIPLHPVPPSAKMADLNLNQEPSGESLPLSLKLSTPIHPSSDEQSSSSPVTHRSAFQAISNEDSIISVA